MVEQKEEECDDYEDDEEYEEEEEEEEYESWAAAEESHFRFKPLVIGLVIFGIFGVGAVVFATALNDPADKFDSAPILQSPSDDASGLSANGGDDRPFDVKSSGDRPRTARAAEPANEVAPPAPAPEEAAEEVEPEAVAVEEPPAEPEPVAETEAEQLVAAVEPAPAEDGYTEVLSQANKERNRKKKEELLRQAIDLDPSGDEALATLAMMLMERGKTRDEALALATRAVEANPDNGLGWLVIGYVKQVVGKAAEAKDAYRKCAGCSGPKKYVRECRLLG